MNSTSAIVDLDTALKTSQYTSVGQDLLPSLVQSFGLIFIGYLFGKFRILPTSSTRGLCIFVQYLSLPALVFRSVANISFSNVNWTLIASVFTAKVIIFFTVSLVTMLLTRPSHVGKAGLYGIVTTQSNDFALGYPLFESLYQDNHHNYPALLYVIAPIQLLVLNPVGFFMLEIFKQRQETAGIEHSICSLLKGIFMNPIIAMTILGIIWNFAFTHTIFFAIDLLLKALSNAFPAIALFLLGNNMVDKIGLLKGHFSIVPALLVVTKVLILPLILQKIIVFLSLKFDASEIQNLSSFGFLYGAIPSAPSVFVFACQYDLSKDVIAATIALSTLFSAPLMLVSETMISLSHHGFQNLPLYIETTTAYCCMLSLLCCIWLLGIFLVGKHWSNISYGATIYLVFVQLIMSTGGTLLFSRANAMNFTYTQYLLMSSGIFSSRLLTTYLAVLLLLLQWRSLCYILRAKCIMNIVAFVISLIIAFAISAGLLLCKEIPSNHYQSFPLGYIQILSTAVLTGICLIVTIICLIFQHRYRKENYYKSHNFMHNTDVPYSASSQHSNYNTFQSQSNNDEIRNNLQENSLQEINFTGLVDIEDVASIETERNIRDIDQQNSIFKTFCDSNFHCSVNQRSRCREAVDQYIRGEAHLEENKHILKHVVLLLLLSSSMLISFAVCLWKLFADASTGIFVELEFLDVILTQGQGAICFIVLGLDNELIRPINNIWNRLQEYRKSNTFNGNN